MHASVGIVAGGGHIDKPLLKADHAYHKYKAKRYNWPRTHGVAMNPVDHLHVGGNHQHIGRRRMEDGSWRMEVGQWQTAADDGRWKANNGQRVGGKQRADDRQMAEGRRQGSMVDHNIDD